MLPGVFWDTAQGRTKSPPRFELVQACLIHLERRSPENLMLRRCPEERSDEGSSENNVHSAQIFSAALPQANHSNPEPIQMAC